MNGDAMDLKDISVDIILFLYRRMSYQQRYFPWITHIHTCHVTDQSNWPLQHLFFCFVRKVFNDSTYDPHNGHSNCIWWVIYAINNLIMFRITVADIIKYVSNVSTLAIRRPLATHTYTYVWLRWLFGRVLWLVNLSMRERILIQYRQNQKKKNPLPP